MVLPDITDKKEALRKLAKDFRLAGDDALVQQTLKVLTAATGNKEPKADLSYSHMLRKLRKGDKKKLREFQKAFKESFDSAIVEGLEDEAEATALFEALQKIGYDE